MIESMIKLTYAMLSRHFIAAFFLTYSATGISADLSGQDFSQTLKNIQSSSASQVSISRQANSPYVTFLGADVRSPIIDVSTSRLPGDRARNFLQSQKTAFVAAGMPLDLIISNVSTNKNGQSIVRMQQKHEGVIVRGGDVVVEMNEKGIIAVHSKLLSELSGINVISAVNQQDALATATTAILNRYGISDVTFSVPKLEILNTSIFTGKSGLSHLVWFVEATRINIREYIWVDAQTGTVIKSLNQIAGVGKERETFDVAGACNLDAVFTADLTETLVNPVPATVQAAHDLAGLAYDYFLSPLGRDGLTGNTTVPPPVKPIQSMANMCDLFDGLAQPSGVTTQHAAWNGTQMLYALDYAVDDIVGHEYTHAVIEETAQFLMTRESGALAEAFADIFGETIDQKTLDVGDRLWDVGENTPAGMPFRYMLNPADMANASGISFPTKVTDTNYYCGADDDIYIHNNSTVLSHAFALAVQGGTFETVNVLPTNIDKVAQVYYQAMIMLTPTSRFIDAYNAIVTAANNLEITVISTAEKEEIIKALGLVEMDVTPCVSAQIPYCLAGEAPQYVFRDGFENINSGNWVTSVISGVNHWTGGAGSAVLNENIYHSGTDSLTFTPIPRQGTYALYGNGAVSEGGSRVSMTNSVALGANHLIQFEHNFAFDLVEADGSLIEYSANDGPWTDAGPLISQGVGYNGVISSAQFPPNPLGDMDGFVNFMLDDGMMPANPIYDYTSTQLDLNKIVIPGGGALFNIKFRFLMGTDRFGFKRGWVIDDFAIYSCVPDVFKINQGGAALSTNEAGKTALFDVTLSSQPTDSVTIALASDSTTEGVVTSPASKTLTFTPLTWDNPQTVIVTGQSDSIADGDVDYNINLSGTAPDASDAIFNNVTMKVLITNVDDGRNASSGGGGGCSLTTRSQFDPLFPLLLLFSCLYLLFNRDNARKSL